TTDPVDPAACCPSPATGCGPDGVAGPVVPIGSEPGDGAPPPPGAPEPPGASVPLTPLAVSRIASATMLPSAPAALKATVIFPFVTVKVPSFAKSTPAY